jgi:hypothetical protein
MKTTAIVIVAYNRYESFRRLMNSIARIDTLYRNIPLIISIDNHENNNNIIQFSKNFVWPFGKKEIILNQKKLGLKQHIINCGNLTSRFDSVIILEDDLLVSPYFYDYAISVSNFYFKETNVSGFSLYAYERAESANFTFKPIYDGYDSFFMQYPSSWGQCWTKQHWQEFTRWLEIYSAEYNKNKILPDYISCWPETSWKKIFAAYLIDKNKYFVYPKISLSTNFGEVGQHHLNQLNIRQVDLLCNRIKFNFPTFNESNAKYDVGFELKYDELIKLNLDLKNLPRFDIDFYCKKKHDPNDLVLTIANSKNVIHSFSSKLIPLINNVIFNIPGNGLVITKFKNIELNSIGKFKSTFFLEFKFLCKEIIRLVYKKIMFVNK